MKKSGLFVIGAMATVLVLSRAVGAAEMVREFPKYKCKLTMPNQTCSWMDFPDNPEVLAAAVFTDTNGGGFVMLVLKNPVDEQIGKEFVKALEGVFFNNSGLEKTGGQMIECYGLPCYELSYRFSEDGRLGFLRVFAANGFFYQLQVFGPNLSANNAGERDKLFEPFSLIGTPQAPPQRSSRSARGNRYAFSENMGRLAGICLILAAGVWVAMRFRKKS